MYVRVYTCMYSRCTGEGLAAGVPTLPLHTDVIQSALALSSAVYSPTPDTFLVELAHRHVFDSFSVSSNHHYAVAMNTESRLAFVGFRGTADFADVKTDLCVAEGVQLLGLDSGNIHKGVCACLSVRVGYSMIQSYDVITLTTTRFLESC